MTETILTFFTCHKCGGLLTACNDPRPYRCDCISGYVRDWQQPVATLSDVYTIQLRAIVERLDLYRRQNRPDTGDHVTGARTAFAQLAYVD